VKLKNEVMWIVRPADYVRWMFVVIVMAESEDWEWFKYEWTKQREWSETDLSKYESGLGREGYEDGPDWRPRGTLTESE
jgi:hypothetical protein